MTKERREIENNVHDLGWETGLTRESTTRRFGRGPRFVQLPTTTSLCQRKIAKVSRHRSTACELQVKPTQLLLLVRD